MMRSCFESGLPTANPVVWFVSVARAILRPAATHHALYGKSDRYAAYPAEKPCTPEDIAATIYHALGMDPESRIYDPLNRPHSLALGNPILDILT